MTDELKKAIEEVIECLILENMRRPSFTFRRISNLSQIYSDEFTEGFSQDDTNCKLDTTKS